MTPEENKFIAKAEGTPITGTGKTPGEAIARFDEIFSELTAIPNGNIDGLDRAREIAAKVTTEKITSKKKK